MKRFEPVLSLLDLILWVDYFGHVFMYMEDKITRN